jgi:hypothetical protein
LRSFHSFQRFACALAPFSSGQTQETKAIRLPSANHLKASTPGAKSLMRRASPPSGEIR